MSTTHERRAPARPGLPSRWSAGLRSVVAGVPNLLATIVIVSVALATLPRLLSWALANGLWFGDGDACRRAGGACWAFVRAKMPFILFGIYPESERWRPALTSALLVGITIWTMARPRWSAGTVVLWTVTLATSVLLMAGGVAGLAAVPTSAWGGLPVTLLLTIVSLLLAFPLALALALARESRLPAFRWLATALVETLRALPLITILFAAALLMPLLLPTGLSSDTLLRALVAFTLGAAAYLAEILRAGLRSVPVARIEAARALGLDRLAVLRFVVLPEALRKVLPPLTNAVVTVIKNTSLVLVVGLFDLLSAGRVVLSDTAWPSSYAETYLLVALIYFAICFGISRYALRLERQTYT